MASLNDFFTGVLQQIGAPVTANNLGILALFAKSEEPGTNPANPSGLINFDNWNPLNTRSGPGGGFNNPDMVIGQKSTATFLTNGNFPSLLAALRGNAPTSAYAPGTAVSKDLGYWQGHGRNNDGNTGAAKVISGGSFIDSAVNWVGGIVGGVVGSVGDNLNPATGFDKTTPGKAVTQAATDIPSAISGFTTGLNDIVLKMMISAMGIGLIVLGAYLIGKPQINSATDKARKVGAMIVK